MDTYSIINIVNNIDWFSYSGPKQYDPNSISKALIRLITLNDESQNSNVYNEVLFAIGNNHAGTYYPAIIAALPIITTIALTGNSECSKNCALEVLTDLIGSFCPEVGHYNKITSDDLKKFVRDHIKQTSDKFINFYNSNNESNRNRILAKGLFELIDEID